MKKTLLKNSVLAVAMVMGLQTDTMAQYSDYLGGLKLFVNDPASITGVKRSTNNLDGSGWGTTSIAPFFRKPVIEAKDATGIDNDACEVLTNGNPGVPGLSGAVALLYRGDCEFGFKAKKAQDAGADAVIIVNNVVGEPILMGGSVVGPQVTIPVFMINKADGDAMLSKLDAGDSVFVSVTDWGFDLQHDLSWASWGAPSGHAMAMPLSQFQNLNNYPEQYRFYTGGFIANLGLTDEFDITMAAEYRFNSNLIFADSVLLDSLTTKDSVTVAYGNNSFRDFNPTTVGTLNIKHILHSDFADEQPSDNILEYNMLITDSVFCKGRYDMTTGEPVVNLSRRIADPDVSSGLVPNPMVWGPLYYVAKGSGLRADLVKFSVSSDTFTLRSVPDVAVYVFKWDDQNGNNLINAGSIANGGELQLIGTGSVGDFDDDDSSGDMQTVILNDLAGKRNVALEDDATYWVCAQFYNPTGSSNGKRTFIGVDDNINFLGRTFAAEIADSIVEYSAPAYFKSGDELSTELGDTVKMIASGTGYNDYSGRIDGGLAYFPSGQGGVPNISFHVSSTPNSVTAVNQDASKVAVYPNPAKDEVKVQLAFVKQVKSATVRVINTIGQPVYYTDVTNALNQVVSIPTSSLASGNYYVLISEGKSPAVVRQFTVIK